MQVKVTNILQLIGYAFLALIIFLFALVVYFHIRIAQRVEESRRQRANAQLIMQAQIEKRDHEMAQQVGGKPTWREMNTQPVFPKLMTSDPQNLATYEGQYVLVKGNCGKEFSFHIDRHNAWEPEGIDLEHVNQGWVFRGGSWAKEYYVRDQFDGRKLHHQKQARPLLSFRTMEDDLEIDFSEFPEITVKDRVHWSECRYTYSY